MPPRHVKIPVGTRFSRLTVTDVPVTRSLNGEHIYTCKCDCGTIKKYYTHKLKTGHTKSCGCLRKDVRRVEGLKGLIKRGIGLAQNELDFISKVEKELE